MKKQSYRVCELPTAQVFDDVIPQTWSALLTCKMQNGSQMRKQERYVLIHAPIHLYGHGVRASSSLANFHSRSRETDEATRCLSHSLEASRTRVLVVLPVRQGYRKDIRGTFPLFRRCTTCALYDVPHVQARCACWSPPPSETCRMRFHQLRVLPPKWHRTIRIHLAIYQKLPNEAIARR